MSRLTKPRILAEASALLAEVGADALTMRALAARLGVQAGALYWHFTDRQQLVAALAEDMLAGAALPLSYEPARWRERILQQLVAVRRALLAHRDGGRVFAGTFVAEPNTLAVGEVLVGTLREAGLGKREAAWTAMSLVHFILGFVVEEQAARGGDPEVLASNVDRERYPHLADVLTPFTSEDFDARVRFGVRLMLDGVEHALASKRAKATREEPRSPAIAARPKPRKAKPKVG